MAKMWDEKININTNWSGDDSTEGLPVKGSRVQEFIRDQLRALNAAVDGKFGSVKYEGGVIKFYDEDGGKELSSITLTGTSYRIDVVSNRGSNFNVLTGDTEAKIIFTPSTTAIEIGQSQGTPFPEDYTFSLEVDNGSGYVDRTPASNAIKSGESATVDVRNYIKTGSNRIRIIVTGSSSQQTKTTVWTANLTTLSMTCNHTWERAWIGGQAYSINEIYFGGNVAKTLHVKIGEIEYTQKFSASQQYTSVAYEFVTTNLFPGVTGVVSVELWMSAEGVETKHVYFDLMCVKSTEISTAKITVVNNLPDEAVNYSSQTLFSLATYNRTSVSVGIVAEIAGESQVVVPTQSIGVQTQTRIPYTTSLAIDTEETDDIDIKITVDGSDYTLPVNNSNAYIATPGASFYLQPSLRYNSTSDREEIRNTAPSATAATYSADWTMMTWSDSDGWTVDSDSNKVLRLMAGSTLSVPDLKPLATSSANSATIEFMYASRCVADYDKPILTIMDTDEFDESETRGIVLFPTRLLVLTSSERAGVYQRIDLPEDKIIHAAVVLQRNYSGIGRNLCRIYINGRENVTFEYGGTANFGNGCLKVGQTSTDVDLYMFRCYTKALEAHDVFVNYLNAMIDSAEAERSGQRADNNILDAGSISYDLVKRAGFNCLVYETDDALPDLDHPDTSALRLNLHLEYNDHPEWNVIIHNVPCDGQGTTSMRYYRWNLRNKIKDASTVWEYPNYNGGTSEKGKVGYIAGYGLHPTVGTITAKKNVASSPQGHKLGATGLYNDLFKLCEGSDMLPSEDTRVATYQYPMMAFQLYSDGRYEFRGLYTIGPDKKDKNTFGYGATTDYPSLMMLEGPNHKPLGTRFLVPWQDVVYDYANETLTFGGEEGWDADIAAGYSTDKSGDAESIMALYTSEFKPAYEAVYYTSPYIVSVSETGKTLDQINSNVNVFRAGKTGQWDNELLTLYTSDYSLVYYSNATGKYETLPKSTHDMLSFLGLSGNPTTVQIVAARAAKFKTEVFAKVSKSEALFHYAFCEFLAVTDNFAKNTYWRKFKSVSAGGKWGFNQDDLDTIFETDNNGQDTKAYCVEVQDVNASNAAEIFQGQSSAFWTAIRLWCAEDVADKYTDIIAAMQTLAARYKVGASTVHETVRNVISYYFHAQSAKYFPATAYNEDTLYAYLSVWVKNPTAVYNSVPPLTQVHGDHLQTELAWIENRVNYVMSKYGLGGFTGSGDDGLGNMEFTPASAYTLKITPAVDLYPRMSIGGSSCEDSERVLAGEEYEMFLPPSSSTNVYIKGMDLISDLGDLSQLQLASRGGSDEISLDVSGARLRQLVCGSDDADAISFNVTSLKVKGKSLEKVDLTNCVTVKGTLNLKDCSRLKELYLDGTSIATVVAPVGGRITDMTLPSSQSTLFLHTLNLLESGNLQLPELAGIESVYINGCEKLDPLGLLLSIMATDSNVLKYITVIWDGTHLIDNAADLGYFSEIANNIYNTETGEGYGRTAWNGQQVSNVGEKPDLQGKLEIRTNAYSKDIQALETTFPNVDFDFTGNLYQWFEDPEVLRVAVATWGDGSGVLEDTWKNGTINFSISGKANPFCNNSELESFDEFELVSNVLNFKGGDGSGRFQNCTSLKSVKMPHITLDIDYAFKGCTSLEIVDASETTFGTVGNAFSGCTSLYSLTIGGITGGGSGFIANSGVKSLVVESMSCNLSSLFQTASNLETLRVVSYDRERISADYAFGGCTNLTDVTIPFSEGCKITSAKQMFKGCASLSSVELPTISGSCESMFEGCSSLDNIEELDVEMEEVTNFHNMMKGCPITSIPTWWDWTKVKSSASISGTFDGANISSIGDIDTQCSEFSLNNMSKLESIGNVTVRSVNTLNRTFSSLGSLRTIGDMSFPDVTTVDFVAYMLPITSCGNVDLPNLTTYTSSTGEFFFYSCKKLVTLGYINVPKLTKDIKQSGVYYLVNFGGWRGLKVNADISRASKLSSESVHNIIVEAAGGTADAPITVTLHATAKANWQSSEYYAEDAAMASAKNIIIA